MDSDKEFYFKALVNSLPDTIWSFDNQFNLTAANAAFFEIRNQLYKSNIQIGDSFFKDVPESGVRKWKPIYERVLNGERLIMEEERLIQKQKQFVELSLNPVYNDKREITGCMGITHDVTRLYDQEIMIREQRRIIDKLILATDYHIMPTMSKIFAYAEELKSDNKLNENDKETILLMLNNELSYLIKSMNEVVTLAKGAKNI